MYGLCEKWWKRAKPLENMKCCYVYHRCKYYYSSNKISIMVYYHSIHVIFFLSFISWRNCTSGCRSYWRVSTYVPPLFHNSLLCLFLLSAAMLEMLIVRYFLTFVDMFTLDWRNLNAFSNVLYSMVADLKVGSLGYVIL